MINRSPDAYLRADDRAAMRLKALYRSYGYGEYRLSGFEDYSLYAENKSFLDGNGALTFNIGGKLLCLRPDVTLSVVKNIDLSGGDTKKIFYDERVYRKAYGGGDLSELRQIGVEVVGDIDNVTESEVCSLVLGTLGAVADDYLLDISHAGIIKKILDGAGLNGSARKAAVGCLESKNAHDFMRLANELDLSRDCADVFIKLIELPAKPCDAFDRLKAAAESAGFVSELAELKEIADACGERANINFSIGGDSEYYNGVVFKGYVRGVPYAVLSGGRYDGLLQKFGKSANALGFALYLGELDGYFADAVPTENTVITYNDDTAAEAVRRAEELRRFGKCVLLCRAAEQAVRKEKDI